MTTFRNRDLQSLVDALSAQSDIRRDVVVGTDRLSYKGGDLVVSGMGQVLDEEGVTTVDEVLTPTDHFEGQITGVLGVPRKYARRLRAENMDLLDQNVNGWLEQEHRNVTLRTFTEHTGLDDSGENVHHPATARAFLSDRYQIIDNEDALFAALDGIRDAGVEVNVTGCDLSDTKMRVRVDCPGITVIATELMKGYRSPFRRPGESSPVISAGFEIGNSEVGAGAYYWVPRFSVLACDNGIVIQQGILRQIHLGSRSEEGVINWTADTHRKELQLITAKTRDAVATVLNVDYMQTVIADLEAKLTGAELTDPVKTLETIQKKAGWTDDERSGILGDFIKGGDLRPSGVLHAVTSFAQRVTDGDRASELEVGAIPAALSAASV